MVKIGIFGTIKVGIDLLGATATWWGVVVLTFGAVSSVLEVLYALAEHDIKRLLAYHTVENIGIILMGGGASLMAPVITQVAVSLTGEAAPVVSHGLTLFSDNPAQTSPSTPLIFILLLALPLLLYVGARGGRQAFRQRGTPWASGYEYEGAMAASAGSFTQPRRVLFAPLYRIRKTLAPGPLLQRTLEQTTRAAENAEPMLDNRVVMPLASALQRVSHAMQWIQHGDFRRDCLYVVAALVVLLLVTIA